MQRQAIRRSGITVLLGVLLGVWWCGTVVAADKEKLPPDSKKGSKVALPGAVVLPMLPDLIVERCWQALGSCRYTCRFRNTGRGRVPDAQHARAEANISAGLENPAIHNPIALSRIDPAGRLKPPNGFVDYDSGCVAKKADMGLVWIDTNHQITESNETNNGANPKVIDCR